MKRTTILDLRDSPWVDGPGRTILECAEDIDRDKFRIIVGAFDSGKAKGSPYEQEARRRGFDVAKIQEKRSFDLEALKQVIELIRYHKVDIVHTHDFRSNVFGILAAKVTRRPVVATVHGWIINDSKARVFAALDKLLLRFFDHVIVVSEKNLKLLGELPRESCTIIENALRLRNYQLLRPYGKFREEFGIAKDEVVIANIGRLSPEKDQRLFIEAAKAIATNNKKTRFLLFGMGPDRQKLEDLALSNGLYETIMFMGYRNDMNHIYNDLDLVVQTSQTEGMPNVILESLLMEVPVIATDVGGTREVIKDGWTGVLIPADDPEVLIQKIEDFIVNPITYMAMAKRGRIDVMKRFNHADRVARLEAVYECLAGPC